MKLLKSYLVDCCMLLILCYLQLLFLVFLQWSSSCCFSYSSCCRSSWGCSYWWISEMKWSKLNLKSLHVDCCIFCSRKFNNNSSCFYINSRLQEYIRQGGDARNIFPFRALDFIAQGFHICQSSRGAGSRVIALRQCKTNWI